MLALSALALPPLLLWLRARARAAAAAAAPQPPPAAATAGSLAARHGFGLAARRHFLLDFSYVHLNHASYGAAPRAVVQAASREMALIEAYPDRFMRREDEGQAAVARAADALAAELLRAPPGTTAFVENATAGVNAVLRSLRLRPGDVILLTDHTYNACRNAALDVAERTGAEIVTHRMALPLRRGGGGAGSYADGLVEDYAATLASIAPGRLAFCLLDHITSPTALVLPVARLVRACRAAHGGALVMVDGAHAPGMLRDLDVPSLGADWYVGNLHKWCFTLKGVALLHAADSVRESVTQGGIISHFWRRNFSQRFFMQGTLDYSRYLGAPRACEFVRRELGGWRAMQDYNAALVEAGAQVLEGRWGSLGRMLEPAAALAAEGVTVPFLAVVVTPLAWRQWAVQRDGVSSVAGLGEAEALAAALADEGLGERIARAVLAQARVQSVFYLWRVGAAHVLVCRIAAQVYNTLEDYGVLAEAVLAVHAARQAQAQQ